MFVYVFSRPAKAADAGEIHAALEGMGIRPVREWGGVTVTPDEIIVVTALPLSGVKAAELKKMLGGFTVKEIKDEGRVKKRYKLTDSIELVFQ